MDDEIVFAVRLCGDSGEVVEQKARTAHEAAELVIGQPLNEYGNSGQYAAVVWRTDMPAAELHYFVPAKEDGG